MEKFRALATKKVAGVPVIAFLALFMAGLLWYALKLKPAEPEPAITDADAPEGDGDYLSDTSQPVFSATPTIMQPSGGSVTASSSPDTNALYSRRALEWLLSKGVTYGVAKGTLDKWLNGESLTPEEDKHRASVLAQFGIPPEDVAYAPVDSGSGGSTAVGAPAAPAPVAHDGSANPAIDNIYTPPDAYTPPPVFAPSPAPVPPATKQGAPPLVHIVKGNGDTSYRDLGMLYFNSTAFDLIQRMKAQDRNIGKEGPFPAGMHIKIPSANAHYFVATADIRSASAIAGKNGITTQQLKIMNPTTNFPVAKGTRVQVG